MEGENIHDVFGTMQFTDMRCHLLVTEIVSSFRDSPIEAEILTIGLVSPLGEHEVRANIHSGYRIDETGTIDIAFIKPSFDRRLKGDRSKFAHRRKQDLQTKR